MPNTSKKFPQIPKELSIFPFYGLVVERQVGGWVIIPRSELRNHPRNTFIIFFSLVNIATIAGVVKNRDPSLSLAHL
jgi:hypothetical protein